MSVEHERQHRPIIRFVTPLPNSLIASGLAREGHPDPAGSAVAITLQAFPEDAPFLVKVGASSGLATPPNRNPNFPGLFFAFDTPLISPAGVAIPAGANLASLFQFAGVEITEKGKVVPTFFWFVGGSFPERTVVMIARITDARGRKSPRAFLGCTVIRNTSGQQLIPRP